MELPQKNNHRNYASLFLGISHLADKLHHCMFSCDVCLCLEALAILKVAVQHEQDPQRVVNYYDHDPPSFTVTKSDHVS